MTSHELIRRLRNRRTQRGAAMTEAAIIIALMVVIFALMWGSVSYENAKLRAMNDARAEAWQKALSACEDNSGEPGMLQSVGDKASEAGAEPMPDLNSSNQVVGGSGISNMSEFKNDSGYITLVKTRSGAFPGVVGGYKFDMQGKMYVRCNEPTLESQKGKEDLIYGLVFAAGAVFVGIASFL